MTIKEIYEQYNIMPSLQKHQLRVAGVADAIVKHFIDDLDRDAIASLQERISEGRKRFEANKGKHAEKLHFESLVKAAEKVEEQIFEKCDIEPKNITTKSITDTVVQLRNFSL